MYLYLGRVHTLNLSDTGVLDVSALGHVYNLDLSDCQGDIYVYIYIYILILGEIPKITFIFTPM
jgi:hypothetical protein